MFGTCGSRSGIAWGGAAALLTAGWWVVTRHGVTASADPFEITALRFAVSGVLLAPVLWRQRRVLAAVPLPLLAVMVLCAGAPYSLLTGAGLRLAPAGNGGALVAGTLPFFAALLSAVFLKEAIGRARWAGVAVILAGIIGLCGSATVPAAVPAFVAAGLMWACFGVALRRSGLPMAAAVALVCCASAVVYLPAYLLLAPPAAWSAALLPQAFYQGVVSAVVAVYCFGRAVHLLGPARASAFAALVPVLASILGGVLLGEVPAVAEAASVAVLALGAALASGAVAIPLRRPARLPHAAPRATAA